MKLINKYKKMLAENGFIIYEPIKYHTWFNYSKDGKFGYCQVVDGESYLAIIFIPSVKQGTRKIYKETTNELILKDFEETLKPENYIFANWNKIKMYESEEDFIKKNIWYEYRKLTKNELSKYQEKGIMMNAVFNIFKDDLIAYLLDFTYPEVELNRMLLILNDESVNEEFDVLQNPIDVFNVYKDEINDFLIEEILKISKYTNNDPLCCREECKLGVMQEIFNLWLNRYITKEEIIEQVKNPIERR